MEKKVKVEIYEGDPFDGSCCGPGRASPDVADKLRQMLIERNNVVRRLQNELKDKVEIKREIISSRRYDYPEYVRELRGKNKPLPYIFLNGTVACVGKFPSYEEFLALLEPYCSRI
jgi:hypothetical protein